MLPGLVATCRHVIGRRNEPIEILWRDRQLGVGEVLVSSDEKTVDLALVHVDERDHPLLPVAQRQTDGSSLYSFGYQYTERNYNGYSSWGRLAGVAYEAGSSSQLLVVDGANVQPGASGSPLFSLEDGRVVGVVKRSNPDGGGYAVPVEMLEELHPGILSINGDAAPDPSRTRAVLRKYLQRLGEEHRFITMVDLRREVELEKIYMSLTIAPHAVSGSSLLLNVSGALENQGYEPTKGVDARRDLGSPQRHYHPREVALHELLAHQRAIVIGEPGAGKTTLLRHLVSRTCRGELFGGKIPIFIRLPHLKREPGCVRVHLENVYPPYAEALLEASDEGNAVYFLDGLDEVPPTEHGIIQNEVSRIAADGNSVLLSCRSAALPAGLFSSAYRIFEVVGFNRVQQRRFLLQWFGEEGSKAADLERQVQASSGLSAFARNPLLLSMIAIVAENDPHFRLPVHRTRLYERVIQLFLERRRNVDGTPTLSRRFRMRLLEELAFGLFCEGSETFDEDDLLDRIEHFQDRSGKSTFQAVDAETVARVLIEQDGVLTAVGLKSYRFLHLTFQEFLAAQHAVRTDTWRTAVAPHAGDPRWEEVLRIAAGALSPDEASDLLRSVLDAHGGRNYEYVERLLLAGRCASDAEALTDELAESITDEIVKEIFRDSNPEVVVDDATAALALMARGHEAVVRRLFERARELLREETTLPNVLRLVQVLDRVGTRPSTAELMRLLGQFGSPDSGADEALVLVSGALLRALGHSSDLEPARVLIQYLTHESSALKADSALALADLGYRERKALDPALTASDGASRAAAEYVLMRTADAEAWKNLLVRIFHKAPDPTLQLLARQCMDEDWLEIAPDFVADLLQKVGGDVAGAYLMGISQLFVRYEDRRVLEGCVSDETRPLVVRLAALETVVRLAPDAANELLPQLAGSRDRDSLWRCCMATLAATGSSAAHGTIAELIEPGDPGVLEAAALRLFAAVPSKNAAGWLGRVLATRPRFSKPWLRAALALAASGSPAAIQPLRSVLAGETEIGSPGRRVAYRALGLLATSDALELLLTQLAQESSMEAITQAIEALADIGGERAERELLRCLDVASWPRAWPKPLAPVRRGEQRPSDRRRLAAIIALNRVGGPRALPALRATADDLLESGEIRHAAYLAARTVSWRVR